MNNITQKQFDMIIDLICQIQKICPMADTSSINMWLTQVQIEKYGTVDQLAGVIKLKI